jgi:hypothetical protein
MPLLVLLSATTTAIGLLYVLRPVDAVKPLWKTAYEQPPPHRVRAWGWVLLILSVLLWVLVFYGYGVQLGFL